MLPRMGASAGKMFSKAVVWFRRDLRMADNPALHAACLMADTGAPPSIALSPQLPRCDLSCPLPRTRSPP